MAKQLQFTETGEAIDALDAPGGSRDNPGAIATKLKTFEGQIIDGLRIQKKPPMGVHHPTQWRLVNQDPLA